MQKKQYYLIGAGLALLVLLLTLGKTVNPSKKVADTASHTDHNHSHDITFDSINVRAKQRLKPHQLNYLSALEKDFSSTDTSLQKHSLHKLVQFWGDSVGLFEPYIFYKAQLAKLENSEKNLTFAAQQMVNSILLNQDAEQQHWLALEAKVLLDKLLVINPNNDSAKINVGACYMFGNISNQPMEGIMQVKQVVDKNPTNYYAQLVLGLGGKKSMQYDKAIERFLIVCNAQPDNITAILNLAECYELKGDKPNAAKWYEAGKNLIPNKQIKEEISNRIKSLK